jgi:hypothetical protein
MEGTTMPKRTLVINAPLRHHFTPSAEVPDPDCCPVEGHLCDRCDRQRRATRNSADSDELEAMAAWLANNADRPDLGYIDEVLEDPVMNWGEPVGNAVASASVWPPLEGASDGLSEMAHRDEAHRRFREANHARARDERDRAERDAENRRRMGLETNPDGHLVIPGHDAPWWATPTGNASEHLEEPTIDWAEWSRSSR